jgi:lysozyme family protein
VTTLERLIIDHVLLVEGGLVNHPNDPGGVTNFGISLRAYPQLGESGIRALTRDDAARIYYTDYVQKTPSTLPDGFRWFVVDSAVNHGLGRALARLMWQI